MDYMKNKIDRLRENLINAVDAEAVSTASTSAPTEYSTLGIDDKQPSILRNDSHDELKSESDRNDLLSCPASPILPLHKLTDSSQEDSLTHLKGFNVLRQPIFILLLTTTIFCASSVAIAILDRFNMYQATYKFPFPLTHLFFQLLFCEAAMLIWLLLSRIALAVIPQLKGHVLLAENLKWDVAMLKLAAPISISYAVASSAFISCLEYVPMKYTVLFMSPMLICQLALTKFFSPDQPRSIYVALSCLILLIGYVLAALAPALPGMPGFNVQGLIAGLIVSVTLPIHNALVKQGLPRFNYHAMQLLHYVLVSSIVMLLPILLCSGEIFEISANCFFLDEAGLWLMITVLGLVSVLACFSRFLLLTFTSPLTLVVILFAKTALIQVPISELLNKSHVNWVNCLGMFLSSVGLLFYLYLINEHRPKFGLVWRS